MGTENIKKFLQTAYSDENLAALLAHTQDGKLAYGTCCCVAGLPTAGHALKTAGEHFAGEHRPVHPMALRYPECQLADSVSEEFFYLGNPGDGLTPWSDELRRQRLIPLILAEQTRRAALRVATEASEAVTV